MCVGAGCANPLTICQSILRKVQEMQCWFRIAKTFRTDHCTLVFNISALFSTRNLRPEVTFPHTTQRLLWKWSSILNLCAKPPFLRAGVFLSRVRVESLCPRPLCAFLTFRRTRLEHRPQGPNQVEHPCQWRNEDSSDVIYGI